MTANLSDIFFRNLDAYKAGEHLIINQGGQGSSKTYSILQLLYFIAKKETKRITVASYALPHLKQGAMSDFDKILETMGENPRALKNISESTYYIGNSSIEFFGIEGNTAKAHGPRRDILFINECNRKITYEVYDQLSTRTRGAVFLDFNPDQEFWLHEKVLPFFDHVLIKSSFADNPWLPEKELNNILAKYNKPGFENWWRVYGLGELGRLEGAILSNWRYGEFDTSLAFGYGCDFGFNDPDVLVRVAIDQKRKIIYCDEKIYKSGNSADQLRQMIAAHCGRNDLIIADCADARMIAELRRYFNIRPIDKKKWTISEALKMMQDYEIVITEGSANLAKELNNYVWSDKKAGVPMKGFDHTIDAVRYWFMNTITKPSFTQVWQFQ
jgi:phage terminase large subunit